MATIAFLLSAVSMVRIGPVDISDSLQLLAGEVGLGRFVLGDNTVSGKLLFSPTLPTEMWPSDKVCQSL